MALITLLMYLIALLILGFASVWLLLNYTYWKQSKYFRARGIPHLKPNNTRLLQLLLGKISLMELEMLLYQDALKIESPYVGVPDFDSPSLLITDLDLTRNFYVKDSEHFIDRRKFAGKADTLFSKMLISLEGEHWKGMRSKLSPTFTTGKIRRMFGIFDNSSRRLCQFLEKSIGVDGNDVDICVAYSKYATDVIASCAFAIDSKTFDCEPGKPPEFEKMADRLKFKIDFKVFVKMVIIGVSPKLAEWLGFQIIDGEVDAYFRKVIKGVLENRRKTGQRHDDFLQLMMDAQQGLLKNEENLKETLEVMTGTTEGKAGDSAQNSFAESGKNLKIDDDDMVANCVLFLIGGFDTTQSLLIFSAYQLALEQECQDRLREEVNKAFEANNGKLTYEAVNEMNYLDMFINETLRYFPPAPRTERLCTKDYKIPTDDGSGPVIEKGMLVGLPVLGMQRNPKIYENPEKICFENRFDPDRFLPENKAKRHPYAFAPFGHGPRNCIGMRFALMEVKTVIATLVHRFRLEPCGKTDIPVKFAGVSTLKPKNGMWLTITPIGEE